MCLSVAKLGDGAVMGGIGFESCGVLCGMDGSMQRAVFGGGI